MHQLSHHQTENHSHLAAFPLSAAVTAGVHIGQIPAVAWVWDPARYIWIYTGGAGSRTIAKILNSYCESSQ